MRNITLSANEELIAAARARALQEGSTLNAKFRLWLADYAGGAQRARTAMAAIEALKSQISTGGRKFTREEMNER